MKFYALLVLAALSISIVAPDTTANAQIQGRTTGRSVSDQEKQNRYWQHKSQRTRAGVNVRNSVRTPGLHFQNGSAGQINNAKSNTSHTNNQRQSSVGRVTGVPGSQRNKLKTYRNPFLNTPTFVDPRLIPGGVNIVNGGVPQPFFAGQPQTTPSAPNAGVANLVPTQPVPAVQPRTVDQRSKPKLVKNPFFVDEETAIVSAEEEPTKTADEFESTSLAYPENGEPENAIEVGPNDSINRVESKSDVKDLSETLPEIIQVNGPQ